MSEFTAPSIANPHPAWSTVEVTAADCEPSDIPQRRGWVCKRCDTRQDGDPFDGCVACGRVVGGGL